MQLVIAEKPVLGRAIADALPGKGSEKDGCISKGDYIITWVFGHMLSLKEPEDYDIGYKEWRTDVLPIYFPDWGMKIGEDEHLAKGQMSKRQRVSQIGELMKQADAVIHAGDPDDEGQLLIDELLRWFNYRGPVKRLDTANTTTEALKKALRNMTDNQSHESYGWSAYARSVADLMVGINMTRLFTCRNHKLLTVGRVQTPTLGLVVARDKLIEEHKKLKYYDVTCDIDVQNKSVPAKYVPAKDDAHLTDGKILDKGYAENIVKTLTGRQLNNITIAKTTLHESPPLPFNLVKLQSYCSSHFGYSPQQTLDITQSLRENHKAITYNRSDCQYLSDEHFAEAPGVVAAVTKNISYTPSGLDTTIKSKCFDSSKISAHFAIIPTNEKVDIQKLSDRERNVYLAVCKYYLAQFLPNAVKEQTKLVCKLDDGAELRSVSTVILKPGYRAIFKEAEKDEVSELSSLMAGKYNGSVAGAEVIEKETKPPARYTKASLNEDMTRISKYVTDENIKKLLLAKDAGKEGENGSIGTSATRSGIIENLVKRGFLKEEGKKLISTPLGRELYKILPDEIKKADMTAKWWAIQEDIQNGNCSYNDLILSVYDTIKDIVDNSDKLEDVDKTAISSDKKVIGKCPACGGDVIEGKMGYGCTNWKPPKSCKFVIWKKNKSLMLSKINITASMVSKLLDGKEVHTKKLYSQKKDKLFEGNIVLRNDPQYGHIVVVADSTFKK